MHQTFFSRRLEIEAATMMLNGSLVLAHIKVWIVSDSQLMVWKAQSGGGGAVARVAAI